MKPCCDTPHSFCDKKTNPGKSNPQKTKNQQFNSQLNSQFNSSSFSPFSLPSLTIALVGNPNCGKTTLFNALTGARQHVGNWPGVTVERKSGYFIHAEKMFEVVDLPGIYTLIQASASSAVDERIAAEFILSRQSQYQYNDQNQANKENQQNQTNQENQQTKEPQQTKENQHTNLIINIVDASNLERHLYLTTQLLEMGVPLILVLNMIDVAAAKKIQIDIKQLSKELACPVFAIAANKGEGIQELKNLISEFDLSRAHGFINTSNCFDYDSAYTCAQKMPYDETILKAIENIVNFQKNSLSPYVLSTGASVNNVGMNDRQKQENSSQHLHWLAVRLLEDDVYVRGFVTPEILEQAQQQKHFIQEATNEDADILIADARYRFIQTVLQKTISRDTILRNTISHNTISGNAIAASTISNNSMVNLASTSWTSSWTTRIDNLVLNRVLGLPIFLAIMYLLFVFSINIGGAFQDFFDISSQTIFVDGFACLLQYIGAPTWLIALLANGLGKGINTTVTFIPVIASMFLFLALLEDSGYMARAAFVVDRCMRALGLPGKAFVPMIVGFGCNVPAVMAARTLENKRDRILTIMMTPFMSCGARLAIFAVFVTAFFPRGGQNIIFALYLIGIGIAVLTGFLLRFTILKGEPAPLVMELPLYHLPRMKTIFLHAWQRLKGFVYRAGFLILPICVLLGALNAINLDGSMNANDADARSVLSLFGQWVTPIFAPMGIHADNWPATVGLVTGVLAKEVVVGTLNSLYSQLGHFADAATANSFNVWQGLIQALQSIPQNLSQISSVFSNPVLAQAPISSMHQGVYGLMSQRFDGQAGAFAYLLFILLYFPCVSTMAVMMRELHRGWAIFSALWMTGVAYGTAVVFYQAATWARHPLSSSLWIAGFTLFFFGIIAVMRWQAGSDDYANTNTQRNEGLKGAIGEIA
jgi:ferrous iron transport protein B